jgi:hypothetical protein
MSWRTNTALRSISTVGAGHATRVAVTAENKLFTAACGEQANEAWAAERLHCG